MRYMLISFFRKPNGAIDEQVTVSKRIKPADQQMSNIILDFAEKKVMKSVIEGQVLDTTWDKMYTYYQKIYPSLVAQLEREAPITAKSR